jgi:hypothetical protein
MTKIITRSSEVVRSARVMQLEGLAGVAYRRIIRLHIACANSGWIAPPIRQDLVSDRDNSRDFREVQKIHTILRLFANGEGNAYDVLKFTLPVESSNAKTSRRLKASAQA